jgi:hypothetical protein
MSKLKVLRKKLDEQLGLPPESPAEDRDHKRSLSKKSKNGDLKKSIKDK